MDRAIALNDPFSQLQASLGDAYTIKRELGGGGMSRVFVVHDVALDRDVVLKVLPHDLAQSLSAERFTREIKVTAALQEPHIVPVLSAGLTSEGVPWYTMPFVVGDSLRARMNAGKIPLKDCISILRDVARALAYAHEHNVVHRDIKPENVLLSSGTAVVTDFGIAKAVQVSQKQAGSTSATLTRAGTTIGTPAYMAPEQAAGDERTDHRADTYAWGVVAYELLAGAHPFAGKLTPQALITAHFVEKPAPLTQPRTGTPPALNALVLRCLEKDPANRPQSVQGVVKELDAITSGNVAAPSVGRMNVRAIGMAALVLVVLTAYLLTRKSGDTIADADRSVAVLPFDNVGGDSTQEYFSDGLTDEIIGRLASTGLRVSGRNASFAFKGQQATAQKVGAALNVATVLTGRVSRLGENMRVSLELARSTNDAVLWTFSANRKASEILAVQRELIDSVIARFHLAPKNVQIDAGNTQKFLAQDFYFRGRYLGHKFTKNDLIASIAQYNKAIEIDPSYALAYTGIADAYFLLADGYLPPNETYPKADSAVRHALKLDSSSAQAWTMLGGVDALYNWKWAEARREFDKALTLDSLNADISGYEGWYWGALNRADQARRNWARGAALDPFHPVSVASPVMLALFGEPTDSLKQAWKKLPAGLDAIEYGDSFYGILQLRTGDTVKAEQTLKAAEASMGHRSPTLAILYARTNRRADAVKLLADIEATWPAKYIPPEMVAQLSDALGDTTAMYRWLERGVSVRSSWAPQVIMWKNLFVTHRNEPHFLDIRKRIGAPPRS